MSKIERATALSIFLLRVIFLIPFKTLRSLCIDLIIFSIPIALLWLSLPYIIGIFAPFIAGYILYLAANPLNKRLKRRLPGGVCAFISLSVISALVFFVLRGLCMHLISEITSLTQSDSLYSETIPFISRKMASMTSSGGLGQVFSSLFDAFRSQILEILSKLSVSLLSFAKNIPSLLIAIFASVFTAFFLLKDDSVFRSSFRKFFGDKTCSRFAEIKNSFSDVTFSYLKAQLIIESIIFAVLFIGFLYLGVNYALILAFLTAIIDAIPILGTGAVLIPMSVFYFISKNTALGWGFLVLYGIAILTRQLIEPKIVGNKLGIHPLLTIFSIYAGLKLFGVAGLIFGPIAAILIKNLLSARKTH